MHSLHRVLFATFRIRTFGGAFMAETTRVTSQKRNLARIETFFGVRAVHAGKTWVHRGTGRRWAVSHIYPGNLPP